MTLFLLGMLVMWFVYPLLKATQTTMIIKWNNLSGQKYLQPGQKLKLKVDVRSS